MKGRLTLVVGVMVVAAAATGAAARWPVAAASTGSVGVRMTLPTTGLAAAPVCPGPETLVAPAGGQAVVPGGPIAITAAVEGASVTLGDRSLSAGTDQVGVLTQPETAAGLVALRPAASDGSGASPRSLVQLDLARQGDLRGLASAACPVAAARSWLVGGGTQVGRRGRLVLSNPAPTPAVVDVTLYGPTGVVSAPAGSGVVVPANGQVALLCDALAPGLSAMAVEVSVRSGRVSAVLADSLVRGATPGGADDVTPSSDASHTQYVPGIDIAARGITLPSSATDPGAVAVRIVDPGTEAAVAQVRLIGPSGPVTLPNGVVTLSPGAVTDVPITGVPSGAYTAVVDSDHPVIASALVGRTVAAGVAAGTAAAVGHPAAPSDFGWAASVEPLSAPTVIAVPTVEESGRRTPLDVSLEIGSPAASSTLAVTEYDSSGAVLRTVSLTAAASSTAQLSLDPDVAALRLVPSSSASSGARVLAALVLRADDSAGTMISVVSIRPGPTGDGERPTVVADSGTGLRS